jgi:hypothetical protein
MKFDERNQFFFKSPFFYFQGNCAKVCPTDSYFFLAYLVPLDVDVTGNITAKLCEVWSEFNIFCVLVTMATAAILNFSNPKKLPHTNGGYSYKVSKEFMCCIGMEYVVDMENINKRTNHNKMLHATSC